MSIEVSVPGLPDDGGDGKRVKAPDAAAASAYGDIRAILDAARSRVKKVVNDEMLLAYWDVGRRIVETQGERAAYGKHLLRYLAQELTAELGAGFDVTNLRNMRQFHLTFPKRDALRRELSWTHYRSLMRLADQRQRGFYEREAVQSGWSARQLDRQISTQYYERLLSTRKEHRGEVEAAAVERDPATTADDLLKDPYVFEFLGIPEDRSVHERDIEQGLIDKLQEFLLELGRGFSFVARQKRVTAEGQHYWVDLVFYNYILKCFVLVDLKIGRLSHQDVGQMDFYRRIFDDIVKPPEDNPSIGVVLASDKDEAVAKYSILADNVGLYAAKYTTYLPTEDELRAELERERHLIERAIDREEGQG